MNMNQNGTEQKRMMQKLTDAVSASYGQLDRPNFRKIVIFLESKPYRQLADKLRSNGFDLADRTDLNNDVSIQILAKKDGELLALELSGVGPFAVIRLVLGNGQSQWVLRSADAPTPLAQFVAQAVEQAGLQLLDRNTLMQTISMHRFDGSTESTLYQALFTDTDRIP